jgi:hypothetical protein
MVDTLIILIAIATGAPVAVWAATTRPTTPRTWHHHAQLIAGLALLVGGVMMAIMQADAVPSR